MLDVVAPHLATEAGQSDSMSFLGGLQSSAEIDETGGRVATGIEQGLFDALGGGNDDQPSGGYAEQFKALAFNFKRNVPFTVNVYFGHITASELATITSAELLSEGAKKQAEDSRREALEATQLDWLLKNRGAVLASAGIAASEGLLQCPKCKKRQTTYYQKQTRSADEPMTTYASCLTDTCLFRWRFC